MFDLLFNVVKNNTGNVIGFTLAFMSNAQKFRIKLIKESFEKRTVNITFHGYRIKFLFKDIPYISNRYVTYEWDPHELSALSNILNDKNKQFKFKPIEPPLIGFQRVLA